MGEVEGRVDEVTHTAEGACRDGRFGALHWRGRLGVFGSSHFANFLSDLRITGPFARSLAGILTAGLAFSKEHLDQRLQIGDRHIGDSVLSGGVLLMALLVAPRRVTSGIAVATTGAAFHITTTGIVGGVLVLLRFAVGLSCLSRLATLRLDRHPLGGLRNLGCRALCVFYALNRASRGSDCSGLTRSRPTRTNRGGDRTSGRGHDRFGFGRRRGGFGRCVGSFRFLGFRSSSCGGGGLSVRQRRSRRRRESFFSESLR